MTRVLSLLSCNFHDQLKNSKTRYLAVAVAKVVVSDTARVKYEQYSVQCNVVMYDHLPFFFNIIKFNSLSGCGNS